MEHLELLNIIDRAERDGVTILDLSHNQNRSDIKPISDLPPEIGNLSQLTYLALSGNNLNALPMEIAAAQEINISRSQW